MKKKLSSYFCRFLQQKSISAIAPARQPRAVYRQSPFDSKLTNTAFTTCVGLSLCATHLLAPSAALALPEGGLVTAGSADIVKTSSSRVDVNQHTNKAIIDWQSFDIGQHEQTNFQQPSADAVALNRVKSGDPSRILGGLSANGTVMLVNPNGVMFGPGARIDVGGLVATTTDIRNEDFLAGRNDFSIPSDNPDAMVINEGDITIKEAGIAALVSPVVENRGVIQARLGKVVLASGNTFALDLHGDNLIQFDVGSTVTEEQGSGKDLVTNSGQITADGGTVLLTASAASRVVNNVINMSGVVEAKAVEMGEGGEIILHGGDAGVVKVTGGLDASGREEGQRGGSIKVLGEKVGLFDGAHLDASGNEGGGEVLIGGDHHGNNPDIKNAFRTFVGEGAIIEADALANGDGGKVVVWADDTTKYQGSISAKGGVASGDGGLVEVSGGKGVKFKGKVDTSAPKGKDGSLLLGQENITISKTGVADTDDGDENVYAFNGNEGSDPAVIDPTTIVGLLNTNSVILQAQNNLTVAEDGVIDVSPMTGDKHDLSLEAGKNVTIDGAITTRGGAINISANDPDGGTGAGTATVNEKLNTSGGEQAQGAVSISTHGSLNAIVLNADITTRDGSVTFNDAVTVGKDVAIDTTNSGGASGANIIFRGVVNGAVARNEDLELMAGTGDVTFSGDVGKTQALADLDVTAETIIFDNPAPQTVKAGKNDDDPSTVTFNGEVLLKTDLIVNTVNTDKGGAKDNNVEFKGAINADTDNRALTLEAGKGGVTFSGDVGISQALADLDIKADTITFDGASPQVVKISKNNGVPSSTATFNGDVLLKTDLIVTTGNAGTTDNNVEFKGTINADVAANNRALTVEAGAGDVTLDGKVGKGACLGALAVTGNDIAINDEVEARGLSAAAKQNGADNDSITIARGKILDANGGSMSFASDDIAIGAGASLTSTGASGQKVTFVAEKEGHGITLGGADVVNVDGQLTLTEAELKVVDNTFDEIVVGYDTTQAGNITIDAGGLTVNDAGLLLRAEKDAGHVIVDGNLTLAGEGRAMTVEGGTAATRLNADIKTNAGTVTFGNAVELSSNAGTGTRVIETTGGNVWFKDTLEADVAANNRALTVEAGMGGVSFSGDVGTTHALADLDVTADNIIFDGPAPQTVNVSKNNGVFSTATFNGKVLLKTDLIINTDNAGITDNNVEFKGTINADAAAKNRKLTVEAGTSDVSIGGTVGTGACLGALAITGNDIAFNNNVEAGSISAATRQNGTDDDSITIAGGKKLDVNGGSMSFASDDINIGTGAFLTSTGAAGQKVIFAAEKEDHGIILGGTDAVNVDGPLTLTEAELNLVDKTFDEIVVGYDTAQAGNITIEEKGLTVNNTGLRLRVEEGAAHASVDGKLTLAGSGKALTIEGGSAATKLNADIQTNAGAVIFGNAVELGSNAGIDTRVIDSTGGDVWFKNTINADSASNNRELMVAAGTGGVTFSGDVGTMQALADLDVTAGTITFDGSAPRMVKVTENNRVNANVATFNGDVLLKANLVVNTDNAVALGNNIEFKGAINADAASNNRTLTLEAGTGGVTFSGDVGKTRALADLEVTAGAIIFDDPASQTVKVSENDGDSGTATFNGDVLLKTDLTVSTDKAVTVGNNIEFKGAINADAAANNRALNVEAGTGDVTLDGMVGSGARLGALAITGNDIAVNGKVEVGAFRAATKQNGTDDDSITIAEGKTLDANGGSISFASDDIEIGAGSFLTSTGAAGQKVTFTAEKEDHGIILGGDDAVKANGLLTLTAAKLNAVDNTFDEIVVGYDTTQAGNITINAEGLTVNNAGLRLRAEGGAGHVIVDGKLTLAGPGKTLTIEGGTAATGLSADIKTNAGAVIFGNAVELGSNAGDTRVIDTTGGDVWFKDTINADAAANNRALTVDAGTGSATFSSDIGTSLALADLDVAANDIIFDSEALQVVKVNENAGAASTVTFKGNVLLKTDLTVSTGNAGLTNNNVEFRGTINADAAANNRALSVEAGTGGATFSGDVGKGQALADLDVAANAITFDGAGTQTVKVTENNEVDANVATFDGHVLLATDLMFDTVNAGGVPGNNVAFNGAIDADAASKLRTLTVGVGSGDVTFSGDVGTSQSLADLNVAAKNILFAGASPQTVKITQNSGAAITSTFDGHVLLATDLKVDAVNASGATDNNVEFKGAIDADSAANPRTLTIVGGNGDVTFSGDVGTSQALADLDVTAKNIIFAGASPQTVGITGNSGAATTSTFDGHVLLASDLKVDAANAGGTPDNNVEFKGAIDADTASNHRRLTIGAGSGEVTFSGDVGASQALADLDVTAKTILFDGAAQSVRVTENNGVANTATFDGHVLLGTNLRISADNTGAMDNSVKFRGAIDADAAASPRSLTVTAGAGDAIFSGDVGTSHALADLNVTAKTILFDGVSPQTVKVAENDGGAANIATFDGRVLLGTNLTITTDNAGAIDNSAEFKGIIDADDSANFRALTLTAGAGDVTFGGVLGDGARPGAVTISSAKDVIMAGGKAASFSQEAGTGTTTLNGPVDTNSSAGVSFKGTNLVVNDSITTTGGGAVKVEEAGNVIIDEAGVIDSDGSVSITGAGGIHTAGRKIITSNDDVAFHSPTILTGDIAIVTGAGGGNILFGSTLDGNKDLSLDAGTGDVTFNGKAGGAERLGALTIVSANDVSLVDMKASSLTQESGTGTTSLKGVVGTYSESGVSLTGNNLDVNAKIDTSGNGTVTVNETGKVTIAESGDIKADGKASITAAGGISTAGDVTTLGDDVTFASPVTLTGDVAVRTGDGNGNITFSNTVDGGKNLALSAGDGDVVFRGAVGDAVRLGAVVVENVKDMTVAGVKAASFTQETGTGKTIMDGPVNTNGAAGVSLVGTNLAVNSSITTTGNGTVTVNEAGTVDIVDAGDITSDGAVSITGAGGISTAGWVTTTNDNVIFKSPVILKGNVNIDTGSGAGDIVFTSTVDGAKPGSEQLVLEAGAGKVEILGSTGGVTPLANLSITASDITLDDIGTAPQAGVKGGVTANAQKEINLLGQVYNAGSQSYSSSGNTTHIQAPGDNKFFAYSGDIRFKGTVQMENGANLLVSTSAGDISFDSIHGKARENVSLDAGGGGAVTINQKIGDRNKNEIGKVTITADEVDFKGGAGSVSANTILIHPHSVAKDIVIGGNASGGALDFTKDDIAALGNGFSSITFGREKQDGGGAMIVAGKTVFYDPVVFNIPSGGMNVNANIVGLDNASLSFRSGSSSGVVNLNADLITAGNLIDLDVRAILPVSDSLLKNRKKITLDSNGGDIKVKDIYGPSTDLRLLAGLEQLNDLAKIKADIANATPEELAALAVLGSGAKSGRINATVDVWELTVSGSGNLFGRIESVPQDPAGRKAAQSIQTYPAPHPGGFYFNGRPFVGREVQDSDDPLLAAGIQGAKSGVDNSKLFAVIAGGAEGYSEECDSETGENCDGDETASEAGFGLGGENEEGRVAE